MDRAEVIKALEEWRAELDKISGSHTWQYRKKVLAKTIAALREQEQSNEPLTQEELRGMVGEWVWVVVDYQHGDQRYQCNGWALVVLPSFVAYLDQTLPIDFYGKKFLAYRHKLEVANHE